MRYALTLDFPTAGDAELNIPGLGNFKNNETHEISDEQARTFKQMTGVSLGRAFRDVPGYTVERLAKGESVEDDDDEDDGGQEEVPVSEPVPMVEEVPTVPRATTPPRRTTTAQRPRLAEGGSTR